MDGYVEDRGFLGSATTLCDTIMVGTYLHLSKFIKCTTPTCYGDQWRNNSRKNGETEPKQKQHLVVDVTGEGSKVWCYKEQYCIGFWNARSMNQGKLEVVKLEMVRVNVYILGISELKWTGMGEFNSDEHYIYYCGQQSLRRNGVAIIVNKRVWNAVLGCNLKNDRMISVRFQGKPFNIMAIQV